MRFISNGDYIFPFQFPQYLAQHIYIWSYQHGAASPDGIIRLPGRLADILVFALFGNIAVGYFYLISCLVVAFLSFWWFAASFLQVRRRATQLIGALFFTLNPIFLGNISKVGLILAASMLAVALASIKQGFATRRFSYFLLYAFALNISLLHPFTFTINLLVSGIYLVYAARRHRVFIKDKIAAFGIVAIAVLLLNAYFLLPIGSLGTVSKDALSDNVTNQSVDYTSLVDIANTRDIFTGLSLSKGVLKDYDFYGSQTWPFYFLGVFAFYAILFGVYVKVEKRMKPAERRRFVLALATFLVLLALATATFLHADLFIKFLIGLPGGWMFRAPLKWQLYMPLPLVVGLLIALKYVQRDKHVRLLYGALLCTFILMNSYLFVQIYQRLLTPRSLTYFSKLTSVDLHHKNLLFINSAACISFAQIHPPASTELNQIFTSSDVQVKQVESGGVDSTAVNQYDYVLGCRGGLDQTTLSNRYNFSKITSFADDTYTLYRNDEKQPYIHVAPMLYETAPEGISGKYQFTQKIAHSSFDFTQYPTPIPTTAIQDLFGALTPSNFKNSSLVTQINPAHPGAQQVYLVGDKPLFYTISDTAITIAPKPFAGSTPATPTPLALTSLENRPLTVTYNDPQFSYKNTIRNGSLEDGLWQKSVGDCNDYDDQPVLGMYLNKENHTEGKQSLRLEAEQHTACTGPPDVTVTPNSTYLLHFDYASKGDAYAGYYIAFDDAKHTSISKHLDSKNGTWTSFTTEITVPVGATHAHLLLYAYPDGAPGKRGTANYDNLSLTGIPDIRDRFYMVSSAGQDSTAAQPEKPVQVAYQTVNPTKTTVQIQDATKPFYLVTKESYNKLWQLHTNTGVHGIAGLFSHRTVLSQKNHIHTNGNMNGWYIDPQAICAGHTNWCTQSTNGTYTIGLVMEFAPQRWFYIGLVVSAITAVGTGVYVWRDIRRHRRGGSV